HALIVDVEVRARARRAEQDGFRVQPGVAVRPQLLIRGAVEAAVGISAAVDMDPERLRAGEAEVVIAVGRPRARAPVLGVARRAGDGVALGVEPELAGRDRRGAVAELEMTD